MKRALLATGLGLGVLLTLAGCRTLVGIEDLDNAPPDGGNGRPPGNNDGGGGGSEGGGPPQGKFEACLTAQQQDGGSCRPCCKETYGALRSTFEDGDGGACVCQQLSTLCKASCAATTCALQPVKPPGRDCAGCVDEVLGAPQSPCLKECAGNRECEDGVACMEACVASGQ